MPRARILIVEDEYLIAADLEAALEDLGYGCVGVAPDLQTALTLAASKPDLALVDIHLRDGQTGPLIGARLAEEHGMAVLFVTANPRMALDARAPGVIGVLNKPCREEVVAAAVAYALRYKGGASLPSPPSGLTLMGGAT
jgi:DNA-binding response OmpR family regulator